MKNKLFVVLIILMLSTIAQASFMILKIEERVKRHNLIVIGTLRDVSKTETEKLKIESAALSIEKILFGKFKDSDNQNLKIGDQIRVEWTNSKDFACQFGFSANSKAIWILNVDEKGNIEPLGPGSQAELTDLAEVEKYLNQKDKATAGKLINTLNDAEPDLKSSEIEVSRSQNSEISFGLYSLERKINYRPVLTLLVILGAFSLYYLLYRSRFKIR